MRALCGEKSFFSPQSARIFYRWMRSQRWIFVRLALNLAVNFSKICNFSDEFFFRRFLVALKIFFSPQSARWGEKKFKRCYEAVKKKIFSAIVRMRWKFFQSSQQMRWKIESWSYENSRQHNFTLPEPAPKLIFCQWQSGQLQIYVLIF